MAEQQRSTPGRRPYHSPTRQRQAEETRRRILDAARELLLSRGYAGTTVEAIAEVAEVSPKTVSAAFGSKRGVLAELLNPDRFGSRFQELLGQIRVAQEPRRRVWLVAKLSRQVYEAFAPEFELLRGAGAVAPELAELVRQVGTRRRQNQARLVAYLEEQGVLLRSGLDVPTATDELWALSSYDLYRMLVLEQGWSPDRYEAWLAEVLIERLLEPRRDSAAPGPDTSHGPARRPPG